MTFSQYRARLIDMVISTLKRNRRLCLALTGMSWIEIVQLLPSFESALSTVYAERRLMNGHVYTRIMGGGPRGHLSLPLEKLVFILLFLKSYVTYDLMGFYADMSASSAFRNVHLMRLALEKALGRTASLPTRRISTPEEFERLFPGVRDLFMDGTERRVYKPRSQKKRTKLYSGKRKATARKTILTTDEHTKILVMTPTKSSRRHDKRLLDKSHLVRCIPKEIALWVDTGFKSLERYHPQVMMPIKGSKLHPLTGEQKESNKLISSIRVRVERAIAGVKRYKVASDTYRNKLPNLDDIFTLLAAGLWNFHLQCSTQGLLSG